MLKRLPILAALLLSVLLARVASAQHPIQWNGNAQNAIARAQEEMRPLMFWISESADIGDDDDLRDAQEDSFRDPAVVALAQGCYIPVRVARNSRVRAELEKFGLPTAFGLYIALVTPDGKLLEQIDPAKVATPEALAERLAANHRSYLDDLYAQKLKPVITRADAPKAEVRRAVQTVWRLRILQADADVVALLDRKDITPSELARLYKLFASFATRPTIETLLARSAAGDREAVTALARASAAALEFLLPELPTADSDTPTERQLAAYRATVQIARAGAPRPDAFWKTAKREDRTRVLDALRQRAEPVLDYWKQGDGRWN